MRLVFGDHHIMGFDWTQFNVTHLDFEEGEKYINILYVSYKSHSIIINQQFLKKILSNRDKNIMYVYIDGTFLQFERNKENTKKNFFSIMYHIQSKCIYFEWRSI